MGGTELAILANALMLMVAMSLSFDFFSSDDTTSARSNDDDDDAISPLFDAAEYTQTFDGTDGDDIQKGPTLRSS
jgi:hypothetical protein